MIHTLASTAIRLGHSPELTGLSARARGVPLPQNLLRTSTYPCPLIGTSCPNSPCAQVPHLSWPSLQPEPYGEEPLCPNLLWYLHDLLQALQNSTQLANTARASLHSLQHLDRRKDNTAHFRKCWLARETDSVERFQCGGLEPDIACTRFLELFATCE
jgi:hypothetical protein